jgi:hypothetical protein
MQETKLNDIPFEKISAFLPHMHSNFTYLPSNGLRGGTIIVWDRSLTLNHSYVLTFSNTTVLTNNLGLSFMLTNVYGPVQ